MKRIVIDAILVIITLIAIYKGRTNAPDKTLPVPQDTITTPKFYNQTAEEGLPSALIYYNLHHPDIVYAQAQLETGHFKSVGCLEHNNLFGLYDSKHQRYYKFDNWIQSVVAYKNWIQSRYKPPNDYYDFLERIHYASDSLYTWKLKQMVKQNEKRRSIGACSSDSSSLCTPSIPNRVW